MSIELRPVTPRVPVTLLRLAQGNWSNRVYVCPGGFVSVRRGKADVFRWEDIDKIVQDAAPPKPGDDGPPMTRHTTFLVHANDGREFGFEQDSLKRHRQLARLLHAEAQARGIPWEVFVPN